MTADREAILHFACEYVDLALEGFKPHASTPKAELALILRAALVACSDRGYLESDRVEAVNLLCSYGSKRADREDPC